MRSAEVKRKTKETDIKVYLNLDGSGNSDIDSGVGFFDHMLSGMAKHGFMDLNVKIKGDLNIDDHHTIEDAGIVIGKAIKEALSDKKGIKRFGSSIVPMDDALAMVAIDLCGRPYFVSDAEFPTETVGDMHTEMLNEFFYAVSYSAMMNIHIRLFSGENSHHISEAIFKAFGRALDEAVSYDSRIADVLSTKGSL